MTPEVDPQNLNPQQVDLINEGRRLEGIDISLFGYFGGPDGRLSREDH